MQPAQISLPAQPPGVINAAHSQPARVHSSAVERRIADPEVAGSIPVAPFPRSRLAQLVERKTLNLVVVGSSPTVGAFC